MRISIIDGFRGFFILFMLVGHINAEVKTWIGRLNHQYFGWVEDAQGFVFISGAVVGLVYGGIFVRGGGRSLDLSIFRRVRTLYAYHAGLVIFLLFSYLILSNLSIQPDILKEYVDHPAIFSIASLLLVSGSIHMGILPMYIFFLMATPILVRLYFAGHVAAIICASAGLWLLAQTGLIDQLAIYAESMTYRIGYPIEFGIYFNALGWQTLYVAGILCGMMHLQGKLKLYFLKKPEHRIGVFAAIILIFLLGVFDRVIFWNVISPEFSERFLSNNERGDFAAIYVIAFALDLYLFVWLIVAGRESHNKIVRKCGDLIVWFFTLPVLVMLGRHSLSLFTYHVALVYFCSFIIAGREVSEMTGVAVLATSVASLFLFAYLLDRRRFKSRIAAR